MKYFKTLLLIGSVALLTACGGGGGDNTATTPPPSNDDDTIIIEAPAAPEIPEVEAPDETVFNWKDYIIVPTTDFSAIVNDKVTEVFANGSSLQYRWDFRYASGIRYPYSEFGISTSEELKSIRLVRSSRNGFGSTHFDLTFNVTKTEDLHDGDIIGSASIKNPFGADEIFDETRLVDVYVDYIDDEIIKLKFTYHDDTTDSDYNYDIEISPVIGTFDIYIHKDDGTDSNLIHQVEIAPI